MHFSEGSRGSFSLQPQSARPQEVSNNGREEMTMRMNDGREPIVAANQRAKRCIRVQITMVSWDVYYLCKMSGDVVSLENRAGQLEPIGVKPEVGSLFGGDEVTAGRKKTGICVLE
ncbi:hypothetical protein NPIL_103641 [Nephila pilipes]|uniref:Uncharacterized protein n=1 Tax=Nephila pilipes TaxID=299642 RepID=A0A8X6UBU8_NEPPI|nr:hypothetical protein NPIL_103641 [Nephila pilipes]